MLYCTSMGSNYNTYWWKNTKKGLVYNKLKSLGQGKPLSDYSVRILPIVQFMFFFPDIKSFNKHKSLNNKYIISLIIWLRTK